MAHGKICLKRAFNKSSDVLILFKFLLEAKVVSSNLCKKKPKVRNKAPKKKVEKRLKASVSRFSLKNSSIDARRLSFIKIIIEASRKVIFAKSVKQRRSVELEA